MNARKPSKSWVVHLADAKAPKRGACGVGTRGYDDPVTTEKHVAVTCRKCLRLLSKQAVLAKYPEGK